MNEMRITREQYEKAKSSLPKLQKAQETITVWDKTLASLGDAIKNLDVTEIGDDGSITARQKEVPRVTKTG